MAPYWVNPQKAELIKNELDMMLDMGIIEESNNPWASPVVLIPKPDGNNRFCSDFRRLNTVTIPDAFHMPRVDDLLDKIGQAKFLTKIDLFRGYWQVPMAEPSIPISAFVTPQRHFQWKCMAFGLRNALATFQRMVKVVLDGLESFTGAYLGDIIIFSNT
jgi:Reverse transcriptase (RNA-dependent DNA polymerase)